jgi:uncharacterized protein YebE (UPF0316 family)
LTKEKTLLGKTSSDVAKRRGKKKNSVTLEWMATGDEGERYSTKRVAKKRKHDKLSDTYERVESGDEGETLL